jgi:O-succinylbenzoic acid--CoA ligase
MIAWKDHVTLPAMRSEVHFDGREIQCFVNRPPSFYWMFERAVKERPQHECISFNDQHLSYAEVSAEVNKLANGFAARGMKQGDRVVMFISNRPEFITVLFALQRLGVITVPVGTREQGPGLAYIVNQCGAVGIVFDEELTDRIPDAAISPQLKLRVSIGQATSNVEALHTLDGPAVNTVAVNEEDCACILYTSGTTGNPKGAMLTHLNISHSVIHYEVSMKLTKDERGALAVPASHVTGLIALIAEMVHVMGTLVVIAEFKAVDFVPLAARERVTFSVMVPAMYQLCLLQPTFLTVYLSHLRVGSFGGSPMPVPTVQALAEAVPGMTLVNCYGSTESTSPATVMPLGLSAIYNDSIGITLPCATIRIMNDQDQEVAPGESGELWIGGPMVVPGYWNNPEATAKGFAEGCWRSGDLGSKDAQGLVRIFDRIKDMINRGGYKIYSVEVENALMALPGVVEAAVVGHPCPVLGERVHAYVYAPKVTVDAAAVKAHCAARLADYKVPEQVVFTDKPLPRNPNGKLLKRSLRQTA